METTTNRSCLSQELQNRLISFDDQVTEYHQLQKDFVDMTKETARLNQTADALEAEATTANASWKTLAKEKTADQRKINTEIERGLKLKNDAEKFHRTAEVREELHHELSIKMIDARNNIKVQVHLLNNSYRSERLQELMRAEGFVEALSEIYALTSQNKKTEMAQLEKNSGAILASEQQEIADHLVLFFGRTLMDSINENDSGISSVTIVDMPKSVDGEVILNRHLQIKAFKANRGLNHG